MLQSGAIVYLHWKLLYRYFLDIGGLLLVAYLYDFMDKSKNLSESVIFPKGQKIANEYFIGAAWLEMLVYNDSIFNCPIGNVTFEPGARNNWHKHPGGQILLVTGGKGYYQEEGKPVQVLQNGGKYE